MILAKSIVAFVAVFGFGGLFFDAVLPATARQHLWNPAWPPHANLHNDQTMLLGIVNGTLTLVLVFGFRPLTPSLFLVAVALAAAYWVAMLTAAFLTGTAWCDPEFADDTPRPLGLHPQELVSLILLGLLVVAIVLAFGAA